MEKYLIEEYNVIEDKDYLKTENDIKEYFNDNAFELFDCGQGYYQDEVDLICKVGNKFYSVSIYAEISSSKQDYGERLYWLEEITDVTYKEIEKPKPKNKNKVQYNLVLTDYQKDKLESFMKENSIKF